MKRKVVWRYKMRGEAKLHYKVLIDKGIGSAKLQLLLPLHDNLQLGLAEQQQYDVGYLRVLEGE